MTTYEPIDHSAPATEVFDALIERYRERHPYATYEEAEEYAERNLKLI